ncbi:MAG: hypothetical protein AMXMBFR33_16040 [Candidatus Xenobia bacterium]
MTVLSRVLRPDFDGLSESVDSTVKHDGDIPGPVFVVFRRHMIQRVLWRLKRRAWRAVARTRCLRGDVDGLALRRRNEDGLVVPGDSLSATGAGGGQDGQKQEAGEDSHRTRFEARLRATSAQPA